MLCNLAAQRLGPEDFRECAPGRLGTWLSGKVRVAARKVRNNQSQIVVFVVVPLFSLLSMASMSRLTTAWLLAPCPHHLHQLSSARNKKFTAFTVCTWLLLSMMFLFSGEVGHDAIGVDMSALSALFPRACKSFDRRAAE